MKRFGLTVSTILLVLFCSGAVTAKETESKNEKDKEDQSALVYKYLNIFSETLKRAKTDYVEDVSEDKLIEYAINGMLSSLDPHSSYLDAATFKDMREQTSGEFGGLGIEVTMDNGWIKIISPIDDTPAFKAGLQAGDYITHIDGTTVLGETLTQAVDKMRGPLNSKVKLTIRRKNKEPFDVTLTRDNIKIQSVKSEEKDSSVGYIRISSFSDTTTNDVKKAIEKIQKNISEDDLFGYILDLRNNPGGLLDQAVSVADLFLEEGEIVSTRPRRDEEMQRYSATKGDISTCPAETVSPSFTAGVPLRTTILTIFPSSSAAKGSGVRVSVISISGSSSTTFTTIRLPVLFTETSATSSIRAIFNSKSEKSPAPKTKGLFNSSFTAAAIAFEVASPAPTTLTSPTNEEYNTAAAKDTASPRIRKYLPKKRFAAGRTPVTPFTEYLTPPRFSAASAFAAASPGTENDSFFPRLLIFSAAAPARHREFSVNSVCPSVSNLTL